MEQNEEDNIAKNLNFNGFDWFIFLLPVVLTLAILFIPALSSAFNNSFLSCINFYPVFYILIIAILYGISKKNKQLTQSADASNYVRPLLFLASMSFSLISLIIGFKTDVISKYDSNNQSRDDYKWFKTSEILTFPIDQIKDRITPKSNHISDQNVANGTSAINIFIVDKTLSNKTNKKFDSLSVKLNKAFNENISDLYNNKDFETLELSDKILFYLIKNLKHTQGITDIQSDISVLLYDGISTRFQSPSQEFFYKNDKKFNEMIGDYQKTVKLLKKESQITDLNQLLALTKIELNKSWVKDNYKKVNLFFISDLYDDNFKLQQVSNDSYIKNIKNLFESNQIKDFSLIALPSNEINEKQEMAKARFISDCIKFFRSDCFVSKISLQDPSKDLDNIQSELTEDCYQKQFNHNEIEFYSPYNLYSSNNSSKCSLIFDNNDTGKYLKLTSNNFEFTNDIRLSCITKNDKKVLIANDQDFYQLNDSIISLQLESDIPIESNDLFIETYNAGKCKMQRSKIVIIPLLPLTTSLYLNLCYAIFIISTSLIVILPSYIHTYIPIKKSEKPLWIRMGYLLLIGLVISFNLWYFINLSEIGSKCLIYIFVFAVIFVSIYNHFWGSFRLYKREQSK